MHGGRGVEQPQQGPGAQLEHKGARGHNGKRHHGGNAHGVGDALLFARAVVVAHNGHQRVGDAEDGHEHKALQLVIDAEHVYGRLGEGDENFVHAEHHHAAEALHDNGRQPHAVDDANGVPAGAKALDAQADFVVFDMVDGHAQRRAAPLANDGGKRRARHAHGGEAQQAENHDGV